MSIPAIPASDYTPTSDQLLAEMSSTFTFVYEGADISTGSSTEASITDFSWSVLLYSQDDTLATWLSGFDSSLDATKTAIETSCDGLAVRVSIFAPADINSSTNPTITGGPSLCLYKPGQLNCVSVSYDSPADDT